MSRVLAFSYRSTTVLLMMAAAIALPCVAQTPAGHPALSGQAIYEDYCAVCHGRDGKGDGPAARALKTPPVDLTMISRSHSGKFPDADIRKIVLGQEMMPSHGTEAMPMWGKIFTKMGDPNTMGARVDALMGYLRQLQAK